MLQSINQLEQCIRLRSRRGEGGGGELVGNSGSGISCMQQTELIAVVAAAVVPGSCMQQAISANTVRYYLPWESGSHKYYKLLVPDSTQLFAHCSARH